LHNAPGWCLLRGCDATSADLEDDSSWFDLLSRTPTQPDTRHRFVLDSRRRATHVRLDVFPDGGLARLRVYGRPDERGWEQLVLSWWNAMPESHAAAVLRAHGVADGPAQELVRGRPLHTLAELHSSLARLPESAGRSAVISLGRLLGERA
jgi:allantoicase